MFYLKWFLGDYIFRPFLISQSSGRKFLVEETIQFLQTIIRQRIIRACFASTNNAQQRKAETFSRPKTILNKTLPDLVDLLLSIIYIVICVKSSG